MGVLGAGGMVETRRRKREGGNLLMEQRKIVYGPRMKKGGEKEMEKKKALVCLESTRVSYRAGTKVVLKKDHH